MGNYFNKQKGGTLLGLIIGLVAGLAIALVVAMMITKSSGPFNNKQDKQEKPSTSTAAQSADPNQPLYRNREAVKEAAKDFAKDNTEDGKTDVQSAASTPADKTAKPDAKEVAGKPGEKGPYYLQAGAFRSSTDADNMRAKLALLGYEAGVSELISQTGTLYRVRIGPFTQTETMNRMRGKLKENGVDTDVARNLK
jgi:cell division protein FtsN